MTGFQLADEGGLGLPDLADGLLADVCQGTDRGLAACDPRGWHLHRGVVLLDGLLDQLRADVDSLRAGGAVDPAATEEIGVLAAVAASREAEGQAVAALAAVDAAPQVVLPDPGALAGDALLIQQRLHLVERLGVVHNTRGKTPCLRCSLPLR